MSYNLYERLNQFWLASNEDPDSTSNLQPGDLDELEYVINEGRREHNCSFNQVYTIGGEGQGDHIENVYRFTDETGTSRFISESGHYDSWNGTDWDCGEIAEVYPSVSIDLTFLAVDDHNASDPKLYCINRHIVPTAEQAKVIFGIEQVQNAIDRLYSKPSH